MGNSKSKYGIGNYQILKSIKSEWKFAFLSTIVVGILTHIYKFTGILLNGDGFVNRYADQNIIASGRWFLSIACGFSSYFDLPWVNGLFAVFFVAVTSAVVVEILDIKNKIVIILTGALLVTFPSFTEISFFEFTADGFMLAMLLASLSVLMVKFTLVKKYTKRKRLFLFLLSSIFVCFSCGIYQAYISFSLVLAIAMFMLILLDFQTKLDKQTIRTIFLYFCFFLIGIILYYLIWKMCMFVQGVSPTDYRGIDQVSATNVNFPLSLKNIVKSYVVFFLEGNVIKQGFSLYGILNIIFIIFFVVVNVISIVRSKIYKEKIKILFYLIFFFSLPLTITPLIIIAPELTYAIRMMHSVALLWILFLCLCNRYIRDIAANLLAGMVSIAVMNFAIIANIGYFYLDLSMKASLADAMEIKHRITELSENSDFQVAIIGLRSNVSFDTANSEARKVANFTKGLDKTIVYNAYHTHDIIEYFLNYDLELCESPEQLEIIKNSKDFKSMNCYPYKNSIKKIGDIVVVKFSDDYDITEF